MFFFGKYNLEVFFTVPIKDDGIFIVGACKTTMSEMWMDILVHA